MVESTERFYDDLAQWYHLIFEDWNRSIANQGAILGPILEGHTGKDSAYILDCACGIGTQTIGLAQRGHIVVGSDLSRSAVARAAQEATMRPRYNLPPRGRAQAQCNSRNRFRRGGHRGQRSPASPVTIRSGTGRKRDRRQTETLRNSPGDHQGL